MAQVSAVVSGTVDRPIGRGGSQRYRHRHQHGNGRHPGNHGRRRGPLPDVVARCGTVRDSRQEDRIQGGGSHGRSVGESNQTATVDLTLRVGESNQQITVNEDAPLVSVATTDISGLIAQRQIRDLPLNGRSFDLLLTLNPGIVNFTWEKTGGIGVSNSTNGNNFAVEGNRPQQNLFLLNGIEFTGAAENNMQPGGTSQQLLGVDAVREFNVLRDSYGAEYGKRPGAQVLIVTQSGSNDFHGSAYEFLRNSAIDARNFFDLSSVPGFERNQFGVSLGGPIQKDKTFIFGNFEGFQQHLHQTGVDLVPDTNARNGYLPCKLVTPAPSPCPASGLISVGVSPLINAWPAPSPGAPDFGGISQAFNTPLQTIRDDFGTIRLDHIFSQQDTLGAIYTVDDSADFTPTSTNAYSTDVESLREQVASLQETHVFSPALVNTARVGFSRAGYFFTGEPTPGTPAADLPGFLPGTLLGALVVGGSAASNPAAQLSLAGSNNGSNLKVARNLFTYEDQLSYTHGRNQFTFGAWVQRLQSNELLALSQYGQATFYRSADVAARNHRLPPLQPHADATRLAIAVWRAVRGGCHPVDSPLHALARVTHGILQRLE